MEATTYEYFKNNFGEFNLKLVKIKKSFFKKYILFEIWDNKSLSPTFVEKCTDDIKKMYKSIKEHFPNFPITDKHEENVITVMNYSKEDWIDQHYLILEFLFAFIFKSKNYNNIERPKFRSNDASWKPEKIQQSDSFSDDQNSLNVSSNMLPLDSTLNNSQNELKESIPAKKSEEYKMVHKNSIPTNLKLGSQTIVLTEEQLKMAQMAEAREKGSRVFVDLFQCAKNLNSTNFPRILLFEKKLLSLWLNKSRSELFPLKFKLSNEEIFTSRFVNFSDKIMYFYENSRDYIRQRDSFLEMYALIKIDRIRFKEYSETEIFIDLMNESNLVTYQLLIQSAILTDFLLTLCIHLVKKDSSFVKFENYPKPFNSFGDLILKLEEKVDASKAICDEDRLIKISLSYMSLEVKMATKTKTFFLPIVNQLDIIYLQNNGKIETIEITRILDLYFNSEQIYCRYQFHNVIVRRISDYIDAFVSPGLENYHETTLIEQGLKKSIKELQIATFRLKRLFAFRDFVIEKWTELLCFKFPLFTTFVFTFSLIINLCFSFEVFFVTATLTLFFFFNPFLNKPLNAILDSMFFRPEQMNKNYISPKHKQERTKRKDFYLNMNNLEKKYIEKQKLSEKLLNAYDFSSRVPQYMHNYIDFFEKFKNIVLWRNYRKTEAYVFYFVSVSIVFYFFNKESAFVYWICFRVWYGVNYYRRLRIWNENVLNFLIRFFISDVLEWESDTAENYFIKNQTQISSLLSFSKKFSEFIEKWLDVKTPEDFWKNHFQLEQIVFELMYSHKRIILPFYEEKRKPAMNDMMLNFLYSTPSDYYYYLQAKNSGANLN